MSENQEPDSCARPGLIDSVKTLAGTAVSILHTRVELFTTELEEERERVERLLLLGAIGIFCVALGVMMLTLLVVVCFWETHRREVLAFFTFLYLLIGAITAWKIQRMIEAKPRLFDATREELRKDKEHLLGK
jgi:uncharacterized membrane protein YqjE